MEKAGTAWGRRVRDGKMQTCNVALEDYIMARLKEQEEKELAKKARRNGQYKRYHDQVYCRVSSCLTAAERDTFKRLVGELGHTQRNLVEAFNIIFLRDGLDVFAAKVGGIDVSHPGGGQKVYYDLPRDLADMFRLGAADAGVPMSAVIRAGVRAFIKGGLEIEAKKRAGFSGLRGAAAFVRRRRAVRLRRDPRRASGGGG